MSHCDVFRELVAALRQGRDTFISVLAGHSVTATFDADHDIWHFSWTPNLDVATNEDYVTLAARIAQFLVGFVWHDTLAIFDELHAVPWVRRFSLPPVTPWASADLMQPPADDPIPCSPWGRRDIDPDPPPRLPDVATLIAAEHAPPRREATPPGMRAA